MRFKLPGNGEKTPSNRFTKAEKQYRDDGRSPDISCLGIHFLVWLDHPLNGQKETVEWVAKGTLYVRVNGHELPVALSSIQDIEWQVKRVLRSTDETAQRIARNLPIVYELKGPEQHNVPVKTLKSPIQLANECTQKHRSAAIRTALAWQVTNLIQKNNAPVEPQKRSIASYFE